jgi:hypothetical protein
MALAGGAIALEPRVYRRRGACGRGPGSHPLAAALSLFCNGGSLVESDACGLIGTTFRELGWNTLIFFEGAVPISPNACAHGRMYANLKRRLNVSSFRVSTNP